MTSEDNGKDDEFDIQYDITHKAMKRTCLGNGNQLTNFLLAEIFTPEIDKLSYNNLQLYIIIAGKTTPYSNKIIWKRESLYS